MVEGWSGGGGEVMPASSNFCMAPKCRFRCCSLGGVGWYLAFGRTEMNAADGVDSWMTVRRIERMLEDEVRSSKRRDHHSQTAT